MTVFAKAIWSLIVLVGLFCLAVLCVGLLTHTAAELFLTGWNVIA